MNIETAKEIITTYDGPIIRIMEVCGTHTHQNFRMGIRKILPENIKVLSGPGCPVCVTPGTFIDEALALAKKKDVVICTFGDLIRVPGSKQSLADARAENAMIKVVYSPLDAVEYAASHKEKEVVFLSVGFETTTPASCLAVLHAEREHLSNFSILTANKTMTNVYRVLKADIDVYLYPGHVNAITGESAVKELTKEGISGVITGFTAKELMEAFAFAVQGLKRGEPFFANCYSRVVRPEGNVTAQKVIEKVMEPCESRWRGIGTINGSGLRLRYEYAGYDARKKFQLSVIEEKENPACRCGEILRGICRPDACRLFGKTCTPEHPAGACMVSSEGACSAHYQYGDYQRSWENG